MPTAIQVREVPDHIHHRLRARAAAEGMSLSAWILEQLRGIAEQPTREELFDRIRALPPVEHGADLGKLVAEERGERG